MATRLQSTTRWLRWLTPGLEIKRWLLLLMVAELVVVLGFAYFLKAFYETAPLPAQFYYITLQFLPHWMRAVIFGAVGLGLLLYSYVKLTQSVLGPFLPGNSTASVVDVIHAFRLKGRGPRIVAIGGGTGLSSLLRGLKTYTSNLSAIVTVADDGGSSGRLRDEYRILPPGDFRQCLIALADAEPLMKQLFDHRFKEGSLNGHSFGNLFIMAMADVTGNPQRGAGRDRPRIALYVDPAESPGGRHGRSDQSLTGAQGARVQSRVAARRDRRVRRERLSAGDPRPRGLEHVRLRARQLQPLAPADGRPIPGHLQVRRRDQTSRGSIHPRRRRQRPHPVPPRPRQAGPRDHAEGLAGLRQRPRFGFLSSPSAEDLDDDRSRGDVDKSVQCVDDVMLAEVNDAERNGQGPTDQGDRQPSIPAPCVDGGQRGKGGME